MTRLSHEPRYWWHWEYDAKADRAIVVIFDHKTKRKHLRPNYGANAADVTCIWLNDRETY